MTADYTLTLPMLTPENTDGPSRAVLERALAAVGFIPNMYKGMANAPGLLDTYLRGYDALRNSDELSPMEQEVLFLTISRANGCHYCMAAHSMLAAQSSGVPAEVLAALRGGLAIENERVAALSSFAETMLETGGRPSASDVEDFLDAGYSQRAILEVILAIAVKTMSNYANHLLHTETDAMFAGYRWPDRV